VPSIHHGTIEMPHIQKRLLEPTRIRTVPKDGFSWIDRRFIREGFAERLTGPEIVLYFFLCTVADRHGLSFFSDTRTASLVKLDAVAIDRARSGLVIKDLIRYENPLYQVLSLPPSTLRNHVLEGPHGIDRGPRLIGDILKALR
jgi:hypothetical protein